MADPFDITPDLYAGLRPDFGPRIQSFQDMLRESYGLETSVESGLRNARTQAQLYAQGRTAPGPIVTYAPPGSSYHNYGAAVDLRPINMREGPASDVVARALRENPEFGIKGIGGWDPFHVQLNTPISNLREGRATGLPEFTQHEPAGPPQQAEDYRTPTLAYSTLAVAADNPADRAALGARPSAESAPRTGAAPSAAPSSVPTARAMAYNMLDAAESERNAKEWDALFARLRMPGTKSLIGTTYG